MYGSDLCHVSPENVIANVESLILHHAKALNDYDKCTLPDGLGGVYSVRNKSLRFISEIWELFFTIV